jgi:radical SAM superfamily enzyme YgiQ (UPF0313 family)
MNITLLHPEIKNYSQTHRKGQGHLGLGYLAAYLMQQGHSVRVLDAKNQRLTDEMLRQHLVEFKPEIFGVTSMTHEIHAAAAVCEVVKREQPQIWTVVGGAHSSALPERTLEEFAPIDVAVVGEGELTLAEMAQAKASGGKLTELGDVLGIAFRKDGHIVRTGVRPWLENLDEIPFPAWHLFPKLSWGMMTARGCPYGCLFCQRMLGRRMRLRSVDNVLAEIDAIEEKLRQHDIWFRDETFGLNKHWLDEFLEKLHARNQRQGRVLPWGCNSRVNVAELERYRKMKETGCFRVSFGVESGDEAILKRICKDITPQMALKAIRSAQQAGLKAAAFFILGHPGETWQTALKTVRLAARSRADSIAVGVMVPYPGTEIWNMAREGKFGYELLTEDWRAYDKYFGGALKVEGLTLRQLAFLQSVTYIWYYIYNLRFRRFRWFMRKFRREMWTMAKRLLGPIPEPVASAQPRLRDAK